MPYHYLIRKASNWKILSGISATIGTGYVGAVLYALRMKSEREENHSRFMRSIQNRFNLYMNNVHGTIEPKFASVSEYLNRNCTMIDSIPPPTPDGVTITCDQAVQTCNGDCLLDLVKDVPVAIPETTLEKVLVEDHLLSPDESQIGNKSNAKDGEQSLFEQKQQVDAERLSPNNPNVQHSIEQQELKNNETTTEKPMSSPSQLIGNSLEGRKTPARPPLRRRRRLSLLESKDKGFQELGNLFEPILAVKQVNYRTATSHVTDMDPEHIRFGAPFDSNYVISTRIRAGRSLKDHALPPQCTHMERIAVEREVTNALLRMKGDLRGKYLSIAGLTGEHHEQLKADQLLFKTPFSLRKVGMLREWPHARGVFHNKNKNFMVWVNEKDHARVIAMEEGGDIQNVFNRFLRGMTEFEKFLAYGEQSFLKDDQLGHILACPSNFGTGLRASVYVKLPLLSQDKRFNEILETYRLQRRDVKKLNNGERVYDVSNVDRLGFTEAQLVQNVVDGVKRLILIEKNLEDGYSLDDMCLTLPPRI